MKLGIQIYGCMEIFRENPKEFFDKLKSYGYTQIEPCVAFGISKGQIEKYNLKPIWLPNEVKCFKKKMDNFGLELSSCHLFGNPLEHIEDIKKLVVENGIGQIVLNCIAESDDESFYSFTEMCTRVADELAGQGVELWIHNGYHSIYETRGDVSVFEAVLKECGGKVKAQVDVGWVQYAGVDPLEFLKAVNPYLSSVHYKDIKGIIDVIPPEKAHICLGDGVLDVREIAEYIADMDITQLIDQDDSDRCFMDDLRASAEVLKEYSKD